MLLLLVGASFSTLITKRAKSFQAPNVESTTSFTLVSEEKSGEDLILRFQNTTALTITAYTLSLGQQKIGADFFSNTAQKGIAPTAIEEVRIPLINLSTQSQNKIIVLTVVFEDHTAEGDVQAARVIFDRRQGYATQMRRIRSLLIEAADSPLKGGSTTPDSLLKRVKDAVSSLPEKDANRTSTGMKSGLNFAKQWTIKQIARLEAGELDIELQRSPHIPRRAVELPQSLAKATMGLEYIVDKIDEIVTKL